MSRVSAGPYTLDIPSNGRATLYEADGAGDDHELPWGVGVFEALIQFAGEVARLGAAFASSEAARRSNDYAHAGELAREAEEVAFWRFQAFWHRAQHKGLDYERKAHWQQIEADFERIRTEENKDRYSAEDPREIGS